MTLIIENGTGVTGAQSFETVAECEAFALAFFGSNLTGSTAQKEATLWRTFVFMSGLRWKAGVWPTFGGTIPDAVKHAQSVFARAEHAAVGTLAPTVTPANAKVLVEVKGIKWQALNDSADIEDMRPVVAQAFDFIRPWLDYDPSRDGSAGYTGIMVA